MSHESDRQNKKKVLLKLTGELFLDRTTHQLAPIVVKSLIQQLKPLLATHQFGIVIGGGNFFRGSQQGSAMGIKPAIGHQIGMLGTMMNGLMLKDLFDQAGVSAALFCAMPAPEIGKPIGAQTIHDALKADQIMIFTGGTGNPFFTTDTTAILRALQMEAKEVWKGTTIDGVYSADPRTTSNAQKLASIDLKYAINNNLGIMDLTAYAMAERYGITIRVFDLFADHALEQVAYNQHFGSTIS